PPMDPVEEGERFGRLAITGRTSGQRYLPKGALIMKVQCRLFAILAASWLFAVSALGEAVPAAAKKTAVEKGFTLTETYEGSADTDGFISDKLVGGLRFQSTLLDKYGRVISLRRPIYFEDAHDFHV